MTGWPVSAAMRNALSRSAAGPAGGKVRLAAGRPAARMKRRNESSACT